jgi:hypothetical protein
MGREVVKLGTVGFWIDSSADAEKSGSNLTRATYHFCFLHFYT